ncbi:succinate dehydrogenase, cytochrome b556 subunit [Elongatibacter sediminis]|uniref:Succinate dehydrogenase cytochrome b556 subunit n=1 Tax=Elongatibacter sediminis TaxID=3119006 RepID=A0AAW9R9P1_9GAMM
MKQRPLSPFMIGPYYRPQLTSMLSITHRLTGVLLSLVGAPLMLWWLAAVSSGPDAYRSMTAVLGGLPGLALGLVLLFSLWFHFFNGVRHLVWDTGRMLELEAAYRSGWAVLVLSAICTVITLGVLA